jgi:hypothetical protein
VPADWVLNDYGCGMDARPTIVRAPGPQRLCLTLEPATKEVALLNNLVELPNTLVRDPWNGPDVPPGVSARRASVRIGGVVGERAEFRLPDGRYAGWVKLPAQELALSVRTRDAATRQRILDSLELVDVDANGCPTRAQQRRPGPAARPVTSVSVCYYGGSISPLTASTRLTGAAAAELLHALDVARPGRNPDCGTRNGVDVSQVALQLRDADGAVQDTVGVRFQGCINRGIDRGDKQGIVTRSLVDLIMNPLHTGYEFRPDLPE